MSTARSASARRTGDRTGEPEPRRTSCSRRVAARLAASVLPQACSSSWAPTHCSPNMTTRTHRIPRPPIRTQRHPPDPPHRHPDLHHRHRALLPPQATAPQPQVDRIRLRPPPIPELTAARRPAAPPARIPLQSPLHLQPHIRLGPMPRRLDIHIPPPAPHRPDIAPQWPPHQPVHIQARRQAPQPLSTEVPSPPPHTPPQPLLPPVTTTAQRARARMSPEPRPRLTQTSQASRKNPLPPPDTPMASSAGLLREEANKSS